MEHQAHHSELRLARRVSRVFGMVLIVLIATFALPYVLRGDVTSVPLAANTPSEAWLTLIPAQVQATGGLTITKTSDPGSVEPGSTLNYYLTITNDTGTALTPPIIITDRIPDFTVCQSFAVPSPDWDGGCQGEQVVWALNSVSLPDATSLNFTFTVQLTDTIPAGTVIRNDDYRVVQLGGANSDIGAVVVTNTVDTPIWAIEKAVTDPIGPFVAPGGELEYTLTYRNVGGSPTIGTFYITDTVPIYTTLITNSLAHTNYTGLTPGSLITWELDNSVLANGQGSVSYRVLVTDPLTKGLEILNEDYGIQGANVVEPAFGPPVTITVESTPILEISKALLNPRVGPDSDITYRITVTNTGNAIAQDVWVTDTLPVSVAFQSATPSPDGQVGNQYGWNIASLTPNAPQTIDILGRTEATIQDGAVITNTVTITSPTEGATAAAFTLPTTIRYRPEIKTTGAGTVQAEFFPFDPISYTFTYSNTGNQTANTTVFTLTLPKVQVQNINLNGPIQVSNVGNRYILSHDNLAPGEGGSIEVQATVVENPWPASGQNFAATFDVATDPQEFVPDDNLASVERFGRPDEPANGVIVPGGDVPMNKPTLLRASVFDAYVNPVFDGTPLELSISPRGSIVSASSVTKNGVVTATVSSTEPGTATVTALVGTPPNQLVLQQFLNFVPATLGVSKISSQNPIAPGRDLYYTIVVSNTAGPDSGDALNVVLTDTILSPNLIFNGSNPPPTSQVGNTLVYELGTIGHSNPQEIVISATVSQSAPDFSFITNTVQVTGDDSTTAPTATDVTQVIIPVIEKFVSPNTVSPGESLTFTIVYKNKAAVAIDVIITDTLPSEVTNVTVLNNGGATVSNIAQGLLFNRTGLPAGETMTITLSADAVTSPWPTTRESITNRVDSTNSFDPEVQSDTATAFGQPGPAQNIEVSAPSTAIAGSTVPFSVTVRDEFGNLVLNGTQIDFAVSPIGQLGGASVNTVEGVAQNTIQSDTAGNTTITISSGDALVNHDIEFLAPTLSFDKTASPSNVAAGSRVVYSLVITNPSAANVFNVVVTDPLDPDLNFMSASLPPVPGEADYTFNIGTLPANSTYTLLITATTAPDLLPGSFVGNTASLSASGLDTPLTDSVLVQIFVPTLNKVAQPSLVRAGELVTYTITYENATGGVLTNLEITDQMPSQIVSLVSSTPPPSSGTLPNLVYQTASLADGETFEVVLVGRLSQTPWGPTPRDFSNNVSALHDGITSPDVWETIASGAPNVPANISLTATPAGTIVGESVQLEVAVTDAYGNPVLNGTPVVFSVSPVGEVVPTSTTTLNGSASALLTVNQVAEVVVQAESGGLVVTETVAFVSPDELSVGLNKTGPATINPDDLLVYTIVVNNLGSVPATGVQVTDVIAPENLNLAGLTSSPAPSNISGNTYTFNFGVLDGPRNIIITVPVASNATLDEVITNTATVSAIGLENSPSDTVLTVIQAAPVIASNLRKDVTPNFVQAGENLTYTIVYTNEGDVAVTGLRITDTFPAQVAQIVAVNPGSATVLDDTLPMLVFGQDSLAPGAVTTLQIVATVTQTGWTATPTSLVNTVTATTDQQPEPATATRPSTGGPNEAATLTLSRSSLTATVNSNITVTATLSDQYGNPVLNGTTVDFSVSPAATLTPETATTANGSASTAVQANAVGAYNVTVMAEGLQTSTLITFTTGGGTVVLPNAIYLPLVLK